jgi:predicted aspartyl protease
MLFNIIIICLIVAGVAFLINGIEESNKKRVSLDSSMDAANLPIVTFTANSKKSKDLSINFLIDTGANNSVINSGILKNYNYQKSNKTGSIFGMEGNKQEISYANMEFSLNGKKYSEEFQVVDMNNAFDNVEKENGITIHGILGNTFLTRYGYVINFKDFTFYEG